MLFGSVFKKVKSYDLEDIKLEKLGMGNKYFLIHYKLKNVRYGDKVYNIELKIRVANCIVCSNQLIHLDARDKAIQCIEDFKKGNSKAKKHIKEHIENLEKENTIDKYLIKEG